MKFTNVRELRKAKKLTQQELADKADITRLTVNLLETGKLENATIYTLSQVAKVLNTTVDKLIDKE